MDYNDILDALRAGANIEDLAKEAVDALNKANDLYKTEVAERDTQAKRKSDDAQVIADFINDYVTTYYDWNWTPVGGAEVEKLFDDFSELYSSVQELVGFMGGAHDKVKAKAKTAVADPLKEFLKANGLI